MSNSIHIIAILSPAPEKAEQLRDLLTKLAETVKANEPGCLKYELYEQTNPEGGALPDLVFVEEYENKEAHEAHRTTPYFLGTFQTIGQERLLAKAPDIKVAKSVGGFARSAPKM